MSWPLSTKKIPVEFIASNEGLQTVPDGVVIAAGQTLKAGTVIGMITASKQWKAYASGNADGSQVPWLILAQNVDTTTAGNGNNPCVCAAYCKGLFKQSALTGLDANALTVRTNWASLTTTAALDLLAI